MNDTNKPQETSANHPIKSGEIEIDFQEFVRKLWDNRKYILKVTTIFAAIGLLVAIFSAKEYTSSITMVPQLSDGKSKAGGLAGLAAMAGVNLGDMGGGDVLSPTIYPKIMKSVLFKKDLIYTKVKFEDISNEITLYDYYTNEDYQPFNLIRLIKKYTLGLPGVIIRVVKGDRDSLRGKVIGSERYLHFTLMENSVAKILASKVSLSVNEKEGTLFLTANMPEALASTQVAEAARVLLQKYITNFKIDKVKQNLEFVGQRYNEAKKEYIEKQQQLAFFQDANRNVILASTRTVQDRMANEYNLAYNVYSELAKQLEQAKIKVKDATPVLTVVEPAFIPIKNSKPQKLLILIAFGFIGFSCAVFRVLLKNYYKINLLNV